MVVKDYPECHSCKEFPRVITNRHCVTCDFQVGCDNFLVKPAPIPNSVEVSHKASDEQFGGDHYKKMGTQPWDIIDTWSLAERIGFYRGNALKYIMRLNDKDEPIVNAEKAAHYCRKLAEVLSEDDVAKVSMTAWPDIFNAKPEA